MAATRARDGFARLLAVLACLVLPLALVSVWVSGVVTSTDRYVATVAPLASDPVVQRAVEDRLEQLAVSALDSRIGQLDAAVRVGRLGPWLQAHRGQIGDGVRAAVVDAVHTAVTRVVESEEFRPAWEAANRSAHEQLLDALQGDSELVDTSNGVSVQLGTLLDTAFAILVDEGLLPEARVPTVEASFPVLSAAQLTDARRGYSLADAVGLWVPVLAIVLAVAALLLAASRRRVLAWLGWGAALGAFLLLVALALGRSQVLDLVAGSHDDRVLLGAVWDVLVARLRTATIVTVAVGLFVALVAQIAGRRTRATDAVTRTS